MNEFMFLLSMICLLITNVIINRRITDLLSRIERLEGMAASREPQE